MVGPERSVLKATKLVARGYVGFHGGYKIYLIANC